jgi:hypothetical protein
MPYSKNSCRIFFVVLLLSFHHSNAQMRLINPEDKNYHDKLKYLLQAPSVLSSSITEKKWLDLQNFTANWQLSDNPSKEIIFVVSILLDIQNRRFFALTLSADYLYLLDLYAHEVDDATNNPNFKYDIQVAPLVRYNVTQEVLKIYKIIKEWSLQLKSLPHLTKTEIFFCNVFTGNISKPFVYFEQNKENFPDLIGLENYITQQASHCDSILFYNKRFTKRGTAGIMIGSWAPFGKLSALGTDASFGFLLGYRNKKNEYDVEYSLRFPHATPQNYLVERSDSLFSFNYYDGGNVSFDFTHYFVYKLRYEIGFTSSLGYDFFDITGQTSDSLAGKNIGPTEIGSFDFSNGIRFKYFLRPGLYLGISAKYHLINYCNTGGSELKGNAFTIDLILGSH